MCGVWIRAVFACSELTPRSVSHLWISEIFSKNLHAGPSFSEILFLLSLTPRSIVRRGVTYCISRISPRKWIFQKNHLACLTGAMQNCRWVRFLKKCNTISWHCHFKIFFGTLHRTRDLFTSSLLDLIALHVKSILGLLRLLELFH